MMRRILLSLTVLVLSAIDAFAQFDVLTAEQAKQDLSGLKLTSMEIDHIISDYMIPFSSESLQNGLDDIFSVDNIFLCDDILGIKFYVSDVSKYPQFSKYIAGAPCVDYKDSTLSIRKIEPGYYTITQKLLFTDQIKRKIKNLFDTFKTPSVELKVSAYDRDRVATFRDESVLVMKAWFDEICRNSISKQEFQNSLLKHKSLHTSTRAIVVLSDENGKDYFVPNDFVSGRISKDHIYYKCDAASMRELKIYASSYLEKIEKTLKDKECYLKPYEYSSEEYYDDPISKDTKPIPDRNVLYKCERLIMLEGKLFGVFSNNSSNYSVEIGKICPYIYKEQHNKEMHAFLDVIGRYYFWKDGELYYVGYGFGKSDAVYACDGYIKGGGDISIIPTLFLEEKEKFEREAEALRVELIAKRRMESERERKFAEKAIIDKYGAAMGGNINNHKVVLGMTKEMCLESWGYPLEYSSSTNRAGSTEIWVYYSAMLSFVDGKLVQIDKWL